MATLTGSIVLWWVKRDVRLADNACLAEADKLAADVLPFFCFEPSVITAEDSSQSHVHAQWQAVSDLRTSLRRRGAEMVIAYGEVIEKLEKLHSRIPFTQVYSHEEIGNDLTYRRDRAVALWCRDRGIEYREFPQSSVQRGGIQRDRMSKIWQTRIAEAAPLPVSPLRQSEEIRRLASATGFPATVSRGSSEWQPVSETEAQRTLTDFLVQRGLWYRGGISSPNTAFTAGSRLSVHLAWGTISVRQVWHAVQDRIRNLDPNEPQASRWKQSLAAFVSRLHWRDHFTQRLESEPQLEFRSLHPSYVDLRYENDESKYNAWCEGRTGYPMVDAVMRCLAATGFVNFRMRAMVVSFACHVLHLDWRLIHPHLARAFRDYDPGIHLNQLQMQAGVVGWNAIRVYNPDKQLSDWDPDCRFVKRWLPELNAVDPSQILNRAVVNSYPPPIVPFRERAKEMTDRLYAIRRSAEAKDATPAVFARHASRKQSGTFRRPKSSPRSRSARRDDGPTLFDDLEEDQTRDE
ncbi:MAG: deoxyribodipyrimidine photo-lyase [Planctomycetaceae bacterium]|nr:deoxyribodipyrimidine photo-lyase [Planctomycetaceae bacterium]